MGIFDGCLLACDIDGTLMVNGYISPRAIEKIEYFTSNGGMFALATGRSLGAVSMVLNKINGIGASVLLNGCMIYDFSKKKIVAEEVLTEEARNIVEDVYKKFPNIGLEIHSEDKVYLLRENKEVIDHEVYEMLDSIPITIECALNVKWNKVLVVADSDEEYEEVKNFIDSNIIGNVAIPTTSFIDGRTRYYVELVPLNVSKASAVKKLCGILNVKKDSCFAIGDYYNDLEMIKDSDIGCFTADAPDDLKQHADFISGVALDGAVADFIDYLAEKFNANK